MSPRTKEQFAEMREQKSQLISEKALELFAEHGYEATSISMIAKEAGVSKGLIYNYFSSKEEILKEIIEHVVSSVWERLGIEGLEKVDKADMEKFIALFRMLLTFTGIVPKRFGIGIFWFMLLLLLALLF